MASRAESREGDEQTVKVRLLADYWPQEDIRVTSGEVLDLPINDAMKLLSDGKAEYAGQMV